MLIFGLRQLQAAVTVYANHYNSHRTASLGRRRRSGQPSHPLRYLWGRRNGRGRRDRS
jgi:hypothetical protein